MFTRLIAYARGIGGRRRIDAEADEELQFHLQQEIDANVARGLSPAEARRVAPPHLGGVTQTREADSRACGRTSLDALWRDVRHALRSLRATPAFTGVALAVLTLSIGASTAIFSVVDAVILRGLPFPEADRLVAVGELDLKAGPSWEAESAGRAPELHRLARTAAGVHRTRGHRLREYQFETRARPGAGDARDSGGHSRLLLVLGTAPLLGRTFTADNEVNGRALVAVISYQACGNGGSAAPRM